MDLLSAIFIFLIWPGVLVGAIILGTHQIRKVNVVHQEWINWAVDLGLKPYVNFWGNRTFTGRLSARKIEIVQVLKNTMEPQLRIQLSIAEALPTVEVEPFYDHWNSHQTAAHLTGSAMESDTGASSLPTATDPASPPLPRTVETVTNQRAQSLLQAPVVRRLLHALQPHGVAIQHGQVTFRLNVQTQSNEVSAHLETALALASALEAADGAQWRALAAHHGLAFSSSADSWTMVGKAGTADLHIQYDLCTDGRTVIHVTPSEDQPWPDGLVIEPANAYRPAIRTGNPILDAHIGIRCHDPSAIREQLHDPDFTGVILAIVKGHRGWVVSDRIEISREGLTLDFDEVLDDVIDLAERLAALG